MKYICAILGMFWVMGVAMAADPITACPSGYVAVIESVMIISDDACPAGYKSAGAAHSCLLPSPGGSCIMYAPAETDYNDANGTYVFEQVCLLT